MALRFFLPFTSLNRGPALDGEEWDVELWDEEFSGTATETDGDPQGCVIEWESENDPVGAVMASSATYSIVLYEESDMALVTALAGAPKGQFKMVIRRAGSSEVYWAGVVRTEGVSYPDVYFPFHLEIYATDGIADLRDVDYVESEGVPYEGSATIMEHLVNLVEKIGMTDVGTWPTNRFRSTANWYSEDMVTTDGPLAQAEVLHDRFVGKDRDGQGEYWSCYAVLQALMSFANCQFLHEGGMYHVRQLEKYADSTQKTHYYDATGALTSTVSAANLDVTVDYATDDDTVKLAGGRYPFLPPIHEVCVDYRHKTNHNRAIGQAWSSFATDWAVLPGTVYVDDVDTTYIKAKFKIRHKSVVGVTPPNSAIWPVHRLKFFVQIRVEYTGTGNYYYLTRTVQSITNPFVIEPDQMEWSLETSVPDEFVLYSDWVNESDNGAEKSFAFSLTTPSLPTDVDGGKLEVRILHDESVKTDGNPISFIGGNYQGSIVFYSEDPFVGLESPGLGPNPDHETLRTCSEVVDNTEKRYLDTWLGDGPAPFSLSALRVAGVPTELWQIGAAGTAYPLAELLGKQFLRFRKRPQPVYEGAFIHPTIRPYHRFVDGDKAFMATRISVDCFSNIWSGEFLLMDGSVSGISSTTPFIPPVKDPFGPPPLLPPNAPGPVVGTPVVVGDVPFNPLIGGTTPGWVEMTAQSLTTIRTDTLASAFNSSHSLPIVAVGYSWVKAGDQITVTHPTTRHTEIFTVATTPFPTANTLSIDTGETMVKDFPLGSFVKLTPKVAGQVKGWSHYERNVTEEYWEIPGSAGILPNVADYDEKTLRERVKVIRSGQTMLYNPDAYDDAFDIINADPQSIRFYFPAAGETCYLEVR